MTTIDQQSGQVTRSGPDQIHVDFLLTISPYPQGLEIPS